MTTDSLKAALVHPDMAHRRPAFEAVVARVRANLLRLVRADEGYAVAVISGSGTAVTRRRCHRSSGIVRKFLLLKNGAFGDRLDDIVSCYGLMTRRLANAWGTAPVLADVETALKERRTSSGSASCTMRRVRGCATR